MEEKASKIIAISTPTRNEITKKQRGAARYDVQRQHKITTKVRKTNTKLRKKMRDEIETKITPGHSF